MGAPSSGWQAYGVAKKMSLRCRLYLPALTACALSQCEDLDTVEQARIVHVDHTLRSLKAKLFEYYEIARSFPTQEQGLNALFERPAIDPVPTGWKAVISQIPIDSWGHPYEYRLDSFDGSQIAVVTSLGQDGIWSADDRQVTIEEPGHDKTTQ